MNVYKYFANSSSSIAIGREHYLVILAAEFADEKVDVLLICWADRTIFEGLSGDETVSTE